jgi:hypothetical protein
MSKSIRVTRPSLRTLVTTAAVLLLATAGVLFSAWSPLAQQSSAMGAVTPRLPSDAQMIEHFESHRADFEELVRLYQSGERWEWRRQNGSLTPFPTDAYGALLKKADVEALSRDASLWLPDSYSDDIVERAKGIDFFHAYQHHAIIFRMRRDVYATFVSQLRRTIVKEYFFVPVSPLVKNGEMWWPRSPARGDLYRKAPVLSSLDAIPADWSMASERYGECVYKQIQPQWFITMCNF